MTEFTRDNYFFIIDVPQGETSISQAGINHPDLKGKTYKIWSDNKLLGTYNDMTITSCLKFTSIDKLLRFHVTDEMDNVLECLSYFIKNVQGEFLECFAQLYVTFK